VLASFISTAELEMQTAPAAAAATGGIVSIRTQGYRDRLAVREAAREDERVTARAAALGT
jgi:hypothetical protein